MNDKTLADMVETRAKSTGLLVTVGEAPDNPKSHVPYMTLHFMPVIGGNGSLGDSSTTHTFDWQVTAVGETEQQALWLAGKARDLFNGWVPTVASRSVWPVRQLMNAPFTRRDDQIKPALFVSITQWRLTTQPS